MPTAPTTCPLDCGDACGVLVESDSAGRFVSLGGNRAHGYSRGTLCTKTSWYGEVLTSPERLTTPLVRDGAGELVPASWDEAVQRIARRVSRTSGERILAAWYGGSMGLVARKFPLRAMHALGATRVDGGLCDNTASAGWEAVLGPLIGADLETADRSDLVLLWGCDMTRTLQHLQPALQRLVKRGVPVLAIDVYRTDTIRAIERWGSSGRGYLVHPGSDAALALGLTRLAFERGWADRAFLERECHGGKEFEAHVMGAHDLEASARACGLEAGALVEIAARLARAENPLIKTGVGWTRRRNGGMSMRAVCSMAAVFGRARHVHYESAGAFDLAETAVERPDLRPPGAPARVVTHVQLGGELESGRYDVLFVWGHNPVVVCPDAHRVRAGMQREDLFSVVHEQFLTETAALADVVLPATMFPEHADVYRSYGHRRAQYARPACKAPPGPRSNVHAFGTIARALGLPAECRETDPERVCEELLAASADRFGPGDLERLRAGEPVKLTPPAPPAGKLWDTPSGKVELVSSACAALGQPSMATWVPDDACGDGGRAFWLVCAPSRFTHNSTFMHSARHVRREGTPRARLNPDDARDLGLADGDACVLENQRGRVTLIVRATADVPRGMVRVDGLPRSEDTPERAGINCLVSPRVSDLGNGNVLYSTRVDVLPTNPG